MNTDVWLEPGGHILRESLRQRARSLHQSHQPPTRLEDWLKLREILRERILSLAGSFPPPIPLDIREHATQRVDDYRVVNLTYQSRPDLRVTANLFIPDGDGPFPAVIKLHGHGKEGRLTPNYVECCQSLAMEGFVVLAVDAIGAGERGTRPGEYEYHGDQQGVSLLSVGETLLGMQVYDNMRGIDLLQSLAYVDPQRIGATGASGGGNQTMWLAALDPRIKAAVPVVSVGTFEAYITNSNCWCETLPDGLTITEAWGPLALAAPQPLLLLNALRETNPAFLVKEMVRSYGAARKVYELFDAADRIAYQAIDRPHGYFPEMRDHMLGWFNRWLRGEGTGWPCASKSITTIPEADLRCFPGSSRPADVRSLPEYVSLRTGVAKEDLLNQRTLDREQKVEDLSRMLRLPGGPPYARCSGLVEAEDAGRRVVKFTVESEPDVPVPCTLVLPPGGVAGPVVVAAHPHGKTACYREPLAEQALREGKALCLADLRHLGETAWDHPDAMQRNAARAELWLGRTMIGNWVKDLQAVAAAIEDNGLCNGVELLGFGEAAVAVLAAAALRDAWTGVGISDALSTYALAGKAPVQQYSLFVPGMLRWGDVTLLAALAEAPVSAHSLVHPSGQPLTVEEHAAWIREVERLKERLSDQQPPQANARKNAYA